MLSLSPSDKEALLGRIAADQYGVFNLNQARSVGVSPQTLHRRIAAKRLRRVLTNVFAVPGAPESWLRDAMSAYVWAGEESALSHDSAARLLGLNGFGSRRVHLATVSTRTSPAPNIVVHRVDQALLPEIVGVGNFRVTSPRRTLLDLAGAKHPRTEQALDQGLREGITTLQRLWLLYDEEWTRGRRGIAIMRSLLIERTPCEVPTQSLLEDMMLKIIRRMGLPEPKHQHPISLRHRVVHVDFAYPERRVAIEVDGYAWHMDKRAFEIDRERDNELQELGWRILRFTWPKLRWEPAYVGSMLRNNLAAPPLPAE